MYRKLSNCKTIVVLAVLLVLFIAAGVAEEVRTDASGQWGYVVEDGGATIKAYAEEPSGDLVIPGELDGYAVVGIGHEVFVYCLELTSVTIPDGVLSIGEFAFVGCKGLTSLTIPDSVASIGDSAFAFCEGLTDFTIPAGVTNIGEGTFWMCYGLTSLTIPDHVTSIGDEAFFLCKNLTGITIPESVTSIGVNPFLGCSSLPRIDVSANNPAYAQIDGVLFSKSLETLISYPGAREGAYTIPEGVLHIGDKAFGKSVHLTAVTIPGSVTAIGDIVFDNCTALTDVTIPDSVTSIGEQAFDLCDESDNQYPPNLLLTVPKGSYAARYAEEKGIPYTYVSTPPSDAATMADDDIFVLIGGKTFHFLSGAGGWSTEVVLSEDGRFTGYFHDSDMGDDDEGFPGGTRYECSFSGTFVLTGKIDPFTYELRLTALDIEEDAGVERIEDGVRVISAGAYGIEGGDVFMLYCPGRVTADLPENFLEWMRMPNAWEEIPDALPFYGLYNSVEEFGFFSYAER